MKFYIDFDSTMFNIEKFNEARYKVLEEYGITAETQKEIEKQSSNETNGLYNLQYTYEKICKNYDLQVGIILEKINKIIDNCNIYLYEDTIEFLEYLKNKGHQMYILTFGKKEYQLQKVKGAKIEQYFDEIILTEKLKFDIDINYRDGVFIDDNPRDLEGIYKKNPIEVIRIKRDGAKYSEKTLNIDKIKVYKTLKELQEELEKRSANKKNIK